MIRAPIDTSPFHGEGHRKIWARLHHGGIRSSKPRVLRLMRQAQLLAPSRRPAMAKVEHTGYIITARPNQIWGTGGTLTITFKEGKVTVFAAGLTLRHDHGTHYMSGDLQNEVRFLGMDSSPSFIRQPEGNG